MGMDAILMGSGCAGRAIEENTVYPNPKQSHDGWPWPIDYAEQAAELDRNEQTQVKIIRIEKKLEDLIEAVERIRMEVDDGKQW